MAAIKSRPGWLDALFIYACSRVVVLSAILVAALIWGKTPAHLFDTWDSVWYLRAAHHGWPRVLPIKHGYFTASTIAFFPVLPLIIRYLSFATGLPMLVVGVAVSNLSGLAATLSVWALVRNYRSAFAARRAAVALSFFPGSFVFSLVYSEGLMIAFAAGSLLAARKKRWLLSGLLAALAGATRPDSMVLVPALAIAAAMAIVKRREWRSLVAPALAPAGFVSYQIWLWRHTGIYNSWFVTERGGWRSYLEPLFPFHVLYRFGQAPFQNANNTTVVLGMLLAVACGVGLWRHRAPLPVVVYALGVAGLALFTTPLGARPRFLLDAFPLAISLGQQLSKTTFTLFWSLMGVVLVVLTVVSVLTVYIVP